MCTEFVYSEFKVLADGTALLRVQLIGSISRIHLNYVLTLYSGIKVQLTRSEAGARWATRSTRVYDDGSILIVVLTNFSTFYAGRILVMLSVQGCTYCKECVPSIRWGFYFLLTTPELSKIGPWRKGSLISIP